MALFCIGVFGLLTRRHIISMFLSIELIINAALINFVAFAQFGIHSIDAEAGHVFPLFIIALTSAEMAIGLAIIVALHRRTRTLDIESLKDLHG
jgi:NADH:ubiquinone oxidoreductase subunit K